MGDAEQTPITARIIGRIAEIDAGQWDACAGGTDPFVSHAFLRSLEDSGSAVEDTGWGPRHLVIEDADGRLAAAAPMYLKSHSLGEYVFDHAWAHAYERAGGRYYPKLLVAVPFTPVTGPRLLVRPGEGADQRRRILMTACIELARQSEVSSLHVNFPSEPEWRLLGDMGLLLRTGEQFHWRNEGYRSFDDFLGRLSARKRKAIRRERRDALAEGEITVEVVSGADLREAHWDAFFRFYMDTGSRKWGSPYLNRRFFDLIGERMSDRIALILARCEGRYIAGALNLIGGGTLYGRYWGCVEHHRFLHFEICYYQAIELAIARGLDRVEAGAQGPHKIARGYLPVRTYSAHWVRDAGFRRALADYLGQERREVEAEIDYLGDRSPFRHEGG